MNYIIEVNQEELCTIKTSLLFELERNQGKNEVADMIQNALSAVDRFVVKKDR